MDLCWGLTVLDLLHPASKKDAEIAPMVKKVKILGFMYVSAIFRNKYKNFKR